MSQYLGLILSSISLPESGGKRGLPPSVEDLNATLSSTIGGERSKEPPASGKRKVAEEKVMAAKGKKPQPVVLASKSPSM